MKPIVKQNKIGLKGSSPENSPYLSALMIQGQIGIFSQFQLHVVKIPFQISTEILRYEQNL
ncbi:hypothetical protein U9M73_12560 [Paenibacillus phoenicis]|uniref:Uncharacterized protein n=1 Tax=Paenibacillus phoenicis TaxID=554117 RepID=A0ABU5PLK9_9BACL|nr:hypothetical protein [Paenibacillus phoenicis]MEA3570818.1 hypothetical protein [Paenibacillus phoenicis]